MDNPEKLTTLGPQDTRRRQTEQETQHWKPKRCQTTWTPQKLGGWV